MTATSSAWATLTRPTASFNAISIAGAEHELIHMIVHVFDAKIKGKPWEVEDILRSVVRKFLVNALREEAL